MYLYAKKKSQRKTQQILKLPHFYYIELLFILVKDLIALFGEQISNDRDKFWLIILTDAEMSFYIHLKN